MQNTPHQMTRSPQLQHFLGNQSGALTVEKSVVVAGVIGLVIATFSAISNKTEGLVIKSTDTLNCIRCEDTDFKNPPEGAIKIEGGYLYYGDIDGWKTIDKRGNTDGTRIEIIEAGWRDYQTMDGAGFGVDLESCTGCKGLTKDLTDLRAGGEYTISFSLADPAARGPNPVEVFFGGQSMGIYQASSSSSQMFRIPLTGGSGDGSDNIQFISRGTRDGYGVYIDNIKVR